jgi:hypothetical protein
MFERARSTLHYTQSVLRPSRADDRGESRATNSAGVTPGVEKGFHSFVLLDSGGSPRRPMHVVSNLAGGPHNGQVPDRDQCLTNCLRFERWGGAGRCVDRSRLHLVAGHRCELDCLRDRGRARHSRCRLYGCPESGAVIAIRIDLGRRCAHSTEPETRAVSVPSEQHTPIYFCVRRPARN